MDTWTEDEFRRIARSTRLSPRTIEACHDVLVEGLTGVAAAGKHAMFPSQLSRSLSLLREKQSEFARLVDGRARTGEMEVFTATEVGKAIFGVEFNSSLAEPNHAYEGRVVAKTPVYLIQKVGRTGVLHPVSRLAEVPEVDAEVRIAYGDDLDAPTVTAVRQASRGAELGR